MIFMEILKQMMDMGILVEPLVSERMNALSPNQLSIVVDKVKTERPLVLTEQILEKYLKSSYFKILRNMSVTKRLTIQDFTETINKRYDFVQNLLMRKVELTNIVSINKCNSGKLTVIGMVKKKEPSNGNFVLELEDKTGTLNAVVSKDLAEKTSIDDTIAVYGNYNNKILFGEKVVYPDVPLRKVTYSKVDSKIMFIINQDLSNKVETDADYIFVGNCDNAERAKEHYPLAKIFIISDENKTEGSVNYITKQSFVEIDGVVVLVLFDTDPLSALRKRFISINNSDFLIDILPDIVLTNKMINTNYKSISILGEKTQINLKTRI